MYHIEDKAVFDLYGYYTCIVPVPSHLVEEVVKLVGHKRIIGQVNGVYFRRALVSMMEGGHGIIIGKELREKANIKNGSALNITFESDPEPDQVDIPEELEALLDQDELAAQGWKRQTPGTQRGVAYFISQAKRVDTRVDRTLKIGEHLKNGTLGQWRKGGRP